MTDTKKAASQECIVTELNRIRVTVRLARDLAEQEIAAADVAQDHGRSHLGAGVV